MFKEFNQSIDFKLEKPVPLEHSVLSNTLLTKTKNYESEYHKNEKLWVRIPQQNISQNTTKNYESEYHKKLWVRIPQKLWVRIPQKLWVRIQQKTLSQNTTKLWVRIPQQNKWASC